MKTVVLLPAGFIPAGQAQFSTQTNGTVLDSSGAMIAGAHITLVRGETNRKSETQSVPGPTAMGVIPSAGAARQAQFALRIEF